MKGLSPNAEVALAVVAYSLCSGSLVLVNKLILWHLPFPSLVITVQLWSTLVFIYSAKWLGFLEVDPLKWEFVVPYLVYCVAFSMGVFCNMKSLSISNVETVIVFRAMAPIIVSFLDVFFLGRHFPNTRSWVALAIIVLGAMGYASTDEKFQSQGIQAYTWPLFYLCVISFEMAYGKKIIRSVDLKTRSGPVLYTNLLGWPPMLLFAKMNNEYEKVWEQMWESDSTRFPPGSLLLLFLGCAVGTGIGYSSWWCRGKVSATSFTLIGVMNKCITIISNVLIWDKHASATGIGFLFLCLVGGSIYQQAPMREEKPAHNDESLQPLTNADEEKAATIGDNDDDKRDE
mmetsp:Transcript_1432/g.1986  ORF Transcript_1432/g.1986 Transcript_1432/m.1986 type:complete len:344 (-) Transcript_1432:24-1055(-)